MNGYDDLFLSIWKVFDVALCLIGMWFVLQPLALAEPLGMLVLSRDSARNLNVSARLMDRILSIVRDREGLKYNSRFGRIAGGAFLIAGLAGLFTSVTLPIAMSLAAGVIAWSMALLLTSANRADDKHVASLGKRYPSHVIPWAMGLLVVEAVAEGLLGTVTPIVVGVATLICLGAIWRASSLPAVFFGRDVELERNIDERFRLSRVAGLIFVSQLPSLAWAAMLPDQRLSTISVRIVVLIVSLSEPLLVYAAARRCNRELRLIATSS